MPGAGTPPDGAVRRSRERLYEAHVLTVYGYLARRVGPEVAEELTAEVFIEAFDVDVARPPGSERAWLFGIALRVLRNDPHHRGRRWPVPFRRVRRGRPPGGGDARLGSRLPGSGARSPMATALASLSSVDCEVLLLHAWAELSDVDIATVLDMPAEAVRTRLGRARARLGQAFGGPPLGRPGLS